MELKIPEASRHTDRGICKIEGKEASQRLRQLTPMEREKPMDEEILVCLDGSSFSETILPLARGIAAAKRATLTILRVVSDRDELASEERYVRERARSFGGQARFLVSPDPAAAILTELKENPRSMAAITSRGRTGVMGALLGSVALRVIRGAGRPVLLYHPQQANSQAPANIKTVVVALDGSKFSEAMIPFAAEMRESLRARMVIVQAFPPQRQRPPIPTYAKIDFDESSYLHQMAAKIKKQYGIEPDWEVLYGEPADAICRYVNGAPDILLAMTTHARGGLQRTFLGSVASACLRRTGVPMFVYWPDPVK